MDDNKARYARETNARTLAEVIGGADIFLGLSAGGVLKPEMVKQMARDPMIFAMANPTPEIMPEDALAVRPDAMIGTGRRTIRTRSTTCCASRSSSAARSTVGATTINEEMKLAAVRAIAALAHAEIPEVVAQAYGAAGLRFGRDYLIPKPFDPRLIEAVAPAVARAAADSGVARRPIADLETYRERLSRFVYQSGSAMQPVFAAAKRNPKSVIYAEGEDERVLRAAQVVVDEGIARPLLLGRPEVIAQRIAEFGLRLKPGDNCAFVNLLDPAVYADAADAYYKLRRRDGVSRAAGARRDAQPRHAAGGDAAAHGRRRRDAVRHLRTQRRPPAGGARGDRPARRRAHDGRDADADAARAPAVHLRHARQPRSRAPTQVADIALLAAEEVRRFGITPSVALLSHSSFGSSDAPSALRCGRRSRSSVRAHRSWRSKARCAATRRCRRPSSTRSSPTRAWPGRPTCW